MLVHNVYFYLKSGVDEDRISSFVHSLEELAQIEVVRQIYVGRPVALADPPRGRHDFTVALTVVFDSVADHDVYQKHPLHVRFIEENKDCWDDVVVYDAA